MNQNKQPVISLIDDHPAALQSLAALLTAHNFVVETYQDPAVFLESRLREEVACVVTDLRMPTIDGLHVLRQIKQRSRLCPVIVVSAYVTISEAVKLMKAGADTLIQKPYEQGELLNAINESLEQARLSRDEWLRDEQLNRRFESLTDEEHRVLERIIAGQLTKAIAYELDVSTRTIERRRTSIFQKLQVNSIADLVLLYLRHTQTQNAQRVVDD